MRIVSGGAYKRQFIVSHRLLSLINYLTKWRQIKEETSKIEAQSSASRTSAMFLTSRH